MTLYVPHKLTPMLAGYSTYFLREATRIDVDFGG